MYSELGYENRLRHQLEKYAKHGGEVTATEYSVLRTMTLSYRNCRIDWIPDVLFKSSEAWLVDDLSPLDTCLIGIIAHLDADFRDWIEKELVSYRMPALLGQTPFANNLFETTFGKISIGNHFRSLGRLERSNFLALCCRTGTVSMMKFLIDIGVEINGDDWHVNLLGDAAAAGNMETVYMLLEAGANSSLALRRFLLFSYHLSNLLFKRLLGMLVENVRPASFSEAKDPLLAIIRSSKALRFHPKAPENLLSLQVFAKEGMGREGNQVSISWSYMYQAIIANNASLVELLIHNGANSNVLISLSFVDQDFEMCTCDVGMCTWITFAVMCGSSSCVDVLIQHGADVTALDGAGWSAVHLAKRNTLTSHPRSFEYRFLRSRSISDEEDAETLTVVERACNLRTQGSSSLRDCDESSTELTIQPLLQQHGPTSTLRKHLAKALAVALTPTQISLLHDHLRDVYYDIQKLWSLSFYEALLMRIIYVFSYALLLGIEVNAFVKGHKRIPTPSRSLLSAAALLTLALVWGSSQMGVSWGSIMA